MSDSQERLPPHLLCVGGDDHYMRLPFLLALRDAGIKVSAAGTCTSEHFDAADIPFHRYNFDRFINPLSDIRAVSQLRRIVRACRPDIVQSFDTKPNLYAPFAVRGHSGAAMVRTINGLGWTYSSRSLPARVIAPIYKLLQKTAAPYTDMTIFQNREDMALFEKAGITANRSAVWIPGSGVDAEGFVKSMIEGPKPDQLRSELGLENKRVVMTVTRLTRQKGIPTLLEAAAKVAAKHDDVCFVLVGPRESEGPLAVSQEELDRHKPYVKHIGRRSDVPSLLRMADAFAFPTEYREGVPRVLMEAALAGVPIVTTRMPGCSDLVQDGISGYLVDPGEPEKLAGRICDLLDEPARAKEMAARVGELVQRDFTLPNIVGQYVRTYVTLWSARVADKSLELGLADVIKNTPL